MWLPTVVGCVCMCVLLHPLLCDQRHAGTVMCVSSGCVNDMSSFIPKSW